MTTAWPQAPTGLAWEQLDPLLDALSRAVSAQAVPGGVHQARWEPGRCARAAVDAADGTVELEATAAGVRRSPLARDARLPGLRTLLDPAAAARRLGDVLGEPVDHLTLAPVSYRPRSRCVLRYDALTASGARRVYVKVLAEGPHRYVAASDALGGTARERGLPLLVPPVLATWDDLRAVVLADVPGSSASRLLSDAAGPARARARLAWRLGELLAAVHATVTDPCTARHPLTSAADLVELEGLVGVAWHADPLAAAALAGLGRALAASPPAAPRAAFSHGGFRPGQVVGGAGCLTVLDLDGAGTGDPARDVGSTLAHLAWQAVRRGDRADAADPLAAAVLAGYRAGGGTVGDDALAWWQALAMTRIAGRRYRSVAVAEWPLVPALLRAAADLLGRRRVPAVLDLTDPAGVAGVLRPALRRPPGAPALEVDGAQSLGSARGRRLLMRYRVSGLSEAPVDVIAKVYAEPARAGITHHNLVQLSAAGGPAPTPAGVPEPLALLPEHGLVLYREARGCPMADLPATDAFRAADAARRCGAWLRSVHDGVAALTRHVDLARELSNAAGWAQEVAALDAGLRRPALELAEGLRNCAARLPAAPQVPIHKDLHPGHVLVARDGAVTVIDVDEARIGDPAFDVAHMCAYLCELDRPWTTASRVAFLDAYGDLEGPLPALRTAFYGAYAHLKLAKQVARGNPRWTPAAGPPRVARLHGLLGRGLACLDG